MYLIEFIDYVTDEKNYTFPVGETYLAFAERHAMITEFNQYIVNSIKNNCKVTIENNNTINAEITSENGDIVIIKCYEAKRI